MIKAPRYPDLVDKSSIPLVQAASRFTGVLNVAYHSQTSYAQKHLRRNVSPVKDGCRDVPLLMAATDSGMALRKLHKETVRRQKFLEERKRQADMEEAKRRERVLEERHLRRLEQSKLIRCRVHSINQNQKITQSQRAYSERAFPMKAARSPTGQQFFGATTEGRIPDQTNQIYSEPVVYKRKQQWTLTETNELYPKEPFRSINKPQTGFAMEFSQKNNPVPGSQDIALRQKLFIERHVAECNEPSETGETTAKSVVSFAEPHPDAGFDCYVDVSNNDDRMDVSMHLSESISRGRSIAPSIFEPSKRIGKLQPLSQENLDALTRRECDQKSIQSEPPLRPRLLKIIQNREEDELMRNLANLNEKLVALRLKKSIDFTHSSIRETRENNVGSEIELEAAAMQQPTNHTTLPDIRARKRWLVPKLVRTPTAYSRRNRAR